MRRSFFTCSSVTCNIELLPALISITHATSMQGVECMTSDMHVPSGCHMSLVNCKDRRCICRVTDWPHGLETMAAALAAKGAQPALAHLTWRVTRLMTPQRSLTSAADTYTRIKLAVRELIILGVCKQLIRTHKRRAILSSMCEDWQAWLHGCSGDGSKSSHRQSDKTALADGVWHATAALQALHAARSSA